MSCMVVQREWVRTSVPLSSIGKSAVLVFQQLWVSTGCIPGPSPRQRCLTCQGSDTLKNMPYTIHIFQGLRLKTTKVAVVRNHGQLSVTDLGQFLCIYIFLPDISPLYYTKHIKQTSINSHKQYSMCQELCVTKMHKIDFILTFYTAYTRNTSVKPCF